MRVKLNTGAFGMDLSATGTNRFLFAVDGEQNSANFTVNVNGSAGNWRSDIRCILLHRLPFRLQLQHTGGSADIMVIEYQRC